MRFGAYYTELPQVTPAQSVAPAASVPVPAPAKQEEVSKEEVSKVEEKPEVAAVAKGLPVKYSSVHHQGNCNIRANFKLSSKQNVGWCAAKSKPEQWVQIDAPDEVLWKKIETRGRWIQYVKTYKLKYSNDGKIWKDYPGTLIGNSDSTSSKVNLIEPPIKAKMLRIVVLTFNNHIAMKFEAYYTEY